MPRNRMLLLLACVVGVLIAGGLAWKAGVFDGGPPPSSIGGAFELVDQDGKRVDESVLKGKWSAVFFGFTYCPDICPGTLQALNGAADQLGPKAKDLRIVFVSIDPERDTPANIKQWLEAQRPPAGTIGLTGTSQEVAVAAKAYRVVYSKAGDDENYLMNHSTAIYLMDPKGRFVRVLAYGMTPEQMADQIRAAMRGD